MPNAMTDTMIDTPTIQAGWYPRLAAHPALRRFPASLLSLWLADAGARPLAAGAAWDGRHAAPDCVGVWLPDDPALATEFAGLASLAGLDEARPERRCGAGGWLLQLPAATLREALQHDAALGAALAEWSAAPDQAMPVGTGGGPNPYAWLGVLALPLALGAGLPLLGLSGGATHYLASVSIGLWVWLRHLAPPFVGALLILAALVLSNTVPGTVAFAGFADAGVLLLISILALGYVTQASGLVQRLMHTLLRHIPATAKGYHAGLLGLGFVLTLILPGSAARLQLISSIAAKLGERVAAAGRPFAHLALAAFSGVTAVSTVFLTSNPINFLVLGLLPEQWRMHFGWTTWLVAALGFLLPFTLLYGALFWHLTRRAGTSGTIALPDAPALAGGAWRADEIVAALAIGLFALGAAGSGWHHIAVPIAGLAVYLWLCAYGFLKEDGAQPQINWPMVLYLSAMIGLVRGFNALGLEHELSRALEWLPALARWNAPLFLVALIGITALLRLILPALVCVSVLCVMLIPLMSATSVNPWLIAFIVSTTAEGWFLPYQSSDYQLFRASMGSALNRDEERFIRLNAVVQGLKLLALALAIPYWQWLGIL